MTLRKKFPGAALAGLAAMPLLAPGPVRAQPITCSGPAGIGCAAAFSHARQAAIAGMARASKPEIHCYRLAPEMPEIRPLQMATEPSSGLVNIPFAREESGFCTAFWFDLPAAKEDHAISVKDFGAAGDGVTDDYEAMQKAANYVCKNGGTLLYPAGTYHIGRYAIAGGPSQNNVKNIEYRGCRDVSILGYGAKIDIKGDFVRTADYRSSGYTYSFSNAVIPFDMIASTGFRIEGFEIGGNVDRMRREAGVVESPGFGIRTSECSRYLLRNLHVHHCQTDGILLGAAHSKADRDALVADVISTNNARQGLTIGMLRGAIVVNSVFRDTGLTGGSYGAHAPAAGVDVEPDFLPPTVDVATGEILFVRDRFEENLGWQFVADAENESVTVIGCAVKASQPEASGGNGGYGYMNAAATAVTASSILDVPNGSIVYLHTLNNSYYKYTRSVTYRDNLFNLGRAHSIVCAPGQALPIVFSGNSVFVRAAGPDASAMMLRYGAEFSRNLFFFAAAGHVDSPDAQLAVSFTGSAAVEGNRYQTDLRTAKQRFFVDYGHVGKTQDEIFESDGFFNSGP
jgi:hypothetical protein